MKLNNTKAFDALRFANTSYWTESIVSDTLDEKRQLTLRHIQELVIFFNLSSAVFLLQKQDNLAIA